MKRIMTFIFVLAAGHGASASSSKSELSSNSKTQAKGIKTTPKTTSSHERYEADDTAEATPTLTTTSPQSAKKETWGLGPSLSSPTGVVGQAPLPLFNSTILRGGAGWRSGNGERPFFFGDVLYRLPDWLRIGSARIPVQVGLGVAYQPAHEVWDESVMVRIPFGFYYEFESAPLELSLTFGPNIYRSQEAGTSTSHTVMALLYKF